VANNIDIIVETAMGEGSEWFSPAPIPTLSPVVPGGSLKNRPQSGGSSVAVITTLADAKVVGHQTETSQLCVGEKLMSLRQLVKVAASLYSHYFFTTQVISSGGFAPPAFFNPFLFGASTGTGAGTGIFTKDFLGMLGPYFRFNRGGMRVKGAVVTFPTGSTLVVPPVSNGFVCCAARPASASNLGIFGPDASGTIPSTVDAQPLSDGGMIRVLMPAWQSSTMVPNQYALTTSVPASGLSLRSTSLWIGLSGAVAQGTYSGSVNYDVTRQPADDYELLMFIGPPKFTSTT